jgi:hypothetical protein
MDWVLIFMGYIEKCNLLKIDIKKYVGSGKTE